MENNLKVYEVFYEKVASEFVLARSSREVCLAIAKQTTGETGGVVDVRDADETKRNIAREL